MTIDVESPATGTLLKILVKEGETVPVAQLIGYLGQPGEIAPEENINKKNTQSQISEMPTQVEITRHDPNPEILKPLSISPIARKLAEANQIDYSLIIGTGPGGRIVEADIQNILNADNSVKSENSFRVEKISASKRLTAQKMSESFRDVPHFYLQKQLNVDKLVALREELNNTPVQVGAIHLTFTDFLLKGLAVSIQSHSYMNSSWHEEGIHIYDSVNLGFAVASSKGLIVAVIKDSQSKSLYEIANERSELSKKATDNLLSHDDVSGGTFTLTNLGMYGIDNFLPIINPPQSAILAIGAISEKPVVQNHKVEIHFVLDITLAADHRVVDGAQAAEFIATFVKVLTDSPNQLVE